VRYAGLARSSQAAKVRRIEADNRRRDESANPSTMTDADLVASIYRLQQRNRLIDPHAERGESVHGPRIRALVAEQQSRRASA